MSDEETPTGREEEEERLRMVLREELREWYAEEEGEENLSLRLSKALARAGVPGGDTLTTLYERFEEALAAGINGPQELEDSRKDHEDE